MNITQTDFALIILCMALALLIAGPSAAPLPCSQAWLGRASRRQR
ncbi:hypothetical protein ACFYPZ_39410 [Streptomyces sp. NPDC005506]